MQLEIKIDGYNRSIDDRRAREPAARWQESGPFISSPIAGREFSPRAESPRYISHVPREDENGDDDESERQEEPSRRSTDTEREANETKRSTAPRDALYAYLILLARTREDPVTRVSHYIHDGPPGTRTITPRHGQRNRKSCNPHPKILSRSENTDTSLIIWPPPPARSIRRREVGGREGVGWRGEGRDMRVTGDVCRALAPRNGNT